MMPRPIAFDVTHLVSRLPVCHPSGIDKVDLAYARHFAAAADCAALHYGLQRPRCHPNAAIGKIVDEAARQRWETADPDADDAYKYAVARITGAAEPGAPQPAAAGGGRLAKTARRLAQVKWRLAPGHQTLPRDALYINAAQHAFEFPRFFRWLNERKDVQPVFLVHDLIPLDYPEYFKGGYRDLFARRVRTITRHAAALITTSHAVAERVTREYREHRCPMVPLHIEPLPSSMVTAPPNAAYESELASRPYFIILGTIEPRKNHLLLLNIWRRLAQEHPSPPKLVVVGTRGWENEQVLDVLDRSRLVGAHVVEVSGVADAGLARLIGNARALLMPSFAEGYGLPVVEALALGTPVVASDIPVFREISQNRAIYRHPLDGMGWRQVIEELVDTASPLAVDARAKAKAFRAPDWTAYFRSIEAFLAGL